MRDAFARASTRRKHLTLVHKTNVLTFAGKLWSRIVAEVGEEFPDVEVAYQHIDAATIHMVTDPGRFDVIVTDNLFGDIITDLAAAVSGGIGLAASGNIDATRTNPSMFEPVHGSAPDIAGQGIADPTAAIMSVALLLAHVGEDDAAARVDKAVERAPGHPRRREAVDVCRSATGSSDCSDSGVASAVLVRDRSAFVDWRTDAASPSGTTSSAALRRRGCQHHRMQAVAVLRGPQSNSSAVTHQRSPGCAVLETGTAAWTSTGRCRWQR